MKVGEMAIDATFWPIEAAKGRSLVARLAAMLFLFPWLAVCLVPLTIFVLAPCLAVSILLDIWEEMS